ncbi:MAG: rod shape-determining protein [Oscillospiraceae bacterium]|nr:rod shape-determining protein [Oscillospiraceae bacterium]
MLFAQDMGIDLGTSNTRVYVKGKGIVIDEPSVVAIDIEQTPEKVVAVGTEAKQMLGRTPGSISAVRPLKDGVIADFNVTVAMLSSIIKKAVGNSLFSRPRVMIAIPSGVTEVERKAVHDAAKSAGARYVSLIEAPMAAAIGAGLPVASPVGCMVVDIGGGSAETAILSLCDIVASRSVRAGGDRFDEAIIAYVKKKWNMLIGERTAEDIKIKLGSAYHYEGEGALDAHGRSLADGLPKNIEITSKDVREAISDTVNQMINSIKMTLEKIPPELAADIIETGIMLTGGTARLRGLDRLISLETKMPVVVADEPEGCIIRGVRLCLEKDILNLGN